MCKTIGIGTDICQISRIEKAIEKAHFYERVFTEDERLYLKEKGRARAASAAAMFAAKEAVSKALGTGFAKGVSVSEISVIHNENGAPGIRLTGGAQVRLEAIGGKEVLVSLSHEGDMAMAFALIQG
ncbi:MAG: holo-ACP synthase [Clostridia bacterium]|nr:holo-ACP synthase [Clostridia bacterium]